MKRVQHKTRPIYSLNSEFLKMAFILPFTIAIYKSVKLTPEQNIKMIAV